MLSPAFMGCARKIAASGFSPTDIAGLQWWLDAEQEAYSNDDSVTTFHDQSGNGFDATAGSAPKFKTNILNGKPVVRFAGNYLGAGDQTFLEGVKTIFGVLSTSSMNVVWLSHSQANGTSPYYLQNIKATTGYARTEANNSGTLSGVEGAASVADGTARIWTAVIDANEHVSRFGVNGGTYGTSATTVDISGASRVYLGTLWYNNAPLLTFSGDIAEVIVYDSALSDGDRGDVESYLATKYNIALS